MKYEDDILREFNFRKYLQNANHEEITYIVIEEVKSYRVCKVAIRKILTKTIQHKKTTTTFIPLQIIFTKIYL